ncbi:polysaccharide pyruvyl transferase family protein [Corynebacterium pelargi]|uniref:Polysaccharide pyruvyl transferase n=1 Tax=Corynebacterium pelargi TaxID=1471400 RepID=A0A410W5S9_9CORY|nr:polysaccharide pyruvyl transferase family protein [Corynebacterium pelargi]QAU51389.1 Polysaccharide pyruvyl transferase [Corynebacterium pelargi]GGG81266.1 hypothetical protein GCM10007338_19930 [Corynebacterium pelargi]
MAHQLHHLLSKLPSPVVRVLKSARKQGLEYLDSERSLRRVEQRDQTLFAQVFKQQPKQGAGTVIIASTGSNNIGDQAMLEAAIQHGPKPVTVITRKSSTYVIDDPSVRVRELGDVIYGRGSKVTDTLQALAECIAEHKYLAIIGADIIDGGYHRGSAYRLWSLAKASAENGIDTRVFGFSWGTSISPLISGVAQRAVGAGVRALCRDSVSWQRFQSSTEASATLSADLVFSADHIASAQPQRFFEQPYALLNVSGLIESRHGLVKEYVEVCQYLASTGRRIVLTPHVANSGGNDHLAIEALASHLQARGIDYAVIDTLLRPAQIAAYANAADVVVTGRMHLSIISFIQSTPAVVLGTQGKVEGLLKDLGLEFLLVEPGASMGQAIVQSLKQLDANRESVQQQLSLSLPRMHERSLGNYEGFEYA